MISLCIVQISLTSSVKHVVSMFDAGKGESPGLDLFHEQTIDEVHISVTSFAVVYIFLLCQMTREISASLK